MNLMGENTSLAEIREQGWTDAPFPMSEGDRAEYARLANTVIEIALADEVIGDALNFELNPNLETGPVRSGSFGLSGARNSVDKKITMHIGNQSRSRVDAAMPEREQPEVLRQFWTANGAMLEEVEVAARSMLRKLGADRLVPTIFPSDTDQRSVHLRTVRYPRALAEPVGGDVVSGHADLGIATLHLFETHGHWLQGTPYPTDLLLAEDSPERRAGIRAMREHLRPIEQKLGHATFFLGASSKMSAEVPQPVRDLYACYHAGIRPSAADEIVSEYASDVADVGDRLSVICFMTPNARLMREGAYSLATVSNCRPEYQSE